MSSMALTWAFTSSVAKSSGYMLTSANVIMVSVIVADFLYRKTMPTSVFSQVRMEISTQSYSNFGLKMFRADLPADVQRGCPACRSTSAAACSSGCAGRGHSRHGHCPGQ